MYVCMSTCYSAPSRFLLRGAPEYSADTESEFHAEAHEQLRVKDLPRVPTRRLEVDSIPQPSSCKAPNIPLHHRAPYTVIMATKDGSRRDIPSTPHKTRTWDGISEPVE